ncbi:hypothetical protein IP69_10620 [Bosea sp. AAP35]|uniref:DUF2189 domain-containing protein n=1 Tax=Bosea sp. AAP35 TaxID=1523417 RepID=UPI0006B94356|nr:DUF2189 domain-containing protein [Bosea sp. AAP35]KPF69616.1 hypothetical protein IP69_10620 [Bosea sp. AAP35]
MSEPYPETDATERPRPDPVVRRIGVRDVVEALIAGLRDFQAAPLFGLFFGGIYTLAGLAILLSLTRFGVPYLAYPLAAGFVLIGPFVAVGLYEVSRRREAGLPLAWGKVLGVVFAQSQRELGWMAFVTLFVMMMWLYQVRLLLALFLGFQSFSSFNGFLSVIATTPEGLMFLAVGNLVGAVLAAALFSLTVVSFPLLLDREVDFITAMITSVRAVATNPVPMLGFAAAIVALSAVAMLPVFLGLIVVMPVLGHATWHLYRRVVEPAA